MKAQRLDDQICFALYAASKKFTKFYKEILADFGLTYSQYLVLLALYEQNHLSIKDLGEKLELDSGTLTPLLKRMEANNWVERNRSHEDERVINISLTHHSKLQESTIAAVIDRCVVSLMDDEAEYKALLTLSKKLNHVLTTKLK
ncbi:MarR family winged helix-turn-helix transcriptional regulator [Kurthia sibirica]|uniref:MarR family transcriptional regulator n=1 Tax=Kurthia sibirica TaxID=202750 RepID=A0A2U3APD9_9BACL|nr:MarR family transcriptional regulator [Kurthia sibirica]PWI26420.1 MarR family transcriptional regulator [Kurthia sibirica]GEK32984.1 MarR family transcriptional regulator [Kurthia sibirica]